MVQELRHRTWEQDELVKAAIVSDLLLELICARTGKKGFGVIGEVHAQLADNLFFRKVVEGNELKLWLSM